jgi:hypothetical protein
MSSKVNKHRYGACQAPTKPIKGRHEVPTGGIVPHTAIEPLARQQVTQGSRVRHALGQRGQLHVGVVADAKRTMGSDSLYLDSSPIHSGSHVYQAKGLTGSDVRVDARPDKHPRQQRLREAGDSLCAPSRTAMGGPGCAHASKMQPGRKPQRDGTSVSRSASCNHDKKTVTSPSHTRSHHGSQCGHTLPILSEAWCGGDKSGRGAMLSASSRSQKCPD